MIHPSQPMYRLMEEHCPITHKNMIKPRVGKLWLRHFDKRLTRQNLIRLASIRDRVLKVTNSTDMVDDIIDQEIPTIIASIEKGNLTESEKDMVASLKTKRHKQ